MISMSFHVSILYRNELILWASRTLGELFSSCFCANKGNLLHVTHWSYHYHPLVKIHFQHVISLTYEHMNMCCLVGFTCGYVNIVEEIINNRKDINAKSENGGILLHLACKDNNDEIVSILRID